VDSQATKAFIAEGESKQVFIIPYIFKSNLPLKDIGDAPEMRIVFTGRINPVKNLPAAFILLKQLAAKGVRFVYDIYGDGDTAYIKELREGVRGNQLEAHVHFKGAFSPFETATILERYHFMLQLSHTEGMAMSVVDAMLHGVIPVVTPVGEIPSYLRDHENGIVVNDTTEAELGRVAADMLGVFTNRQRFDTIRNNCINSFNNSAGYCESMLHMIETISSNIHEDRFPDHPRR
jgi:glycosyltransferase involved in cell wall biosynthesis